MYREYDFTTENRNLSGFLQAASDAGLFVNLRIGPFVCAEWNYGGLPLWLRDRTRHFRTNDSAWESEMATFVSYITHYVEPYLARNGGPIILAQIENESALHHTLFHPTPSPPSSAPSSSSPSPSLPSPSSCSLLPSPRCVRYDNMEGGDAGNKEYVQWCGALTQKLDIGIPWVMCSSRDAPAFIINTCNGFYCDSWIEGHKRDFPNQPSLWTEDWSGWFYSWGQPKPSRPVADLAFAVARWIGRGGSHHNY